MGAFSHLEFTDNVEKKQQDYLRIDQRKHRIDADLTTHMLIDNDTKQYVYYMPSLDITSYGETEDKAREMIKSSMDDLFDFLMSLSPRHLKIELAKLGWKQSAFRNKEYSKAYIDINGELQNFNAVESKVERLTLTA